MLLRTEAYKKFQQFFLKTHLGLSQEFLKVFFLDFHRPFQGLFLKFLRTFSGLRTFLELSKDIEILLLNALALLVVHGTDKKHK